MLAAFFWASDERSSSLVAAPVRVRGARTWCGEFFCWTLLLVATSLVSQTSARSAEQTRSDWHGLSQLSPYASDDTRNNFPRSLKDALPRDFRQEFANFCAAVQLPHSQDELSSTASEQKERTERIWSKPQQRRDTPLESSASALPTIPKWSAAYRRTTHLAMHFANRIKSDQPDDADPSAADFFEAWDSAARHVFEGLEKYRSSGRGEDGRTDERLNEGRSYPAIPPHFERRHLLVERQLDDEGCFTATLHDSYGDGWNDGAELSIVLEDTGEVLHSGVTLVDGSEMSSPLCGLGCGCFIGRATAGSYPEENSWVIANLEGAVVAQATADGATTFCLPDGCRICVAGRYSSHDGKECMPCPAGRYKDYSGSAASCAVCGAGKYSENGVGSTTESDCLSCGIGKYSKNSGASSSAACSECEPGKYGPKENSEACVECGAGKFNENSGSATETDCLRCGRGMYSAAGGDACSECGRGTFADVTGMPSCTSCDPGDYTANTGSYSSSDCRHCPEGEYGDLARGTCAPCSVSVERSCILTFTEDLDVAYESAEVGDTIVLTPGTRYTGGKGCGCQVVPIPYYGFRDSSVCVTIAVTIKCSDTERKCKLSGQNARQIMYFKSVEYSRTGLMLEGLSFEDGYAYSALMYKGGALYYGASKATLTSCSFKNNSANGDGGALYITMSEGATLTSCSFTDNSANGRGGGIFFDTSSGATMTSCSFANNASSNSATGHGGALFFSNTDRATLTSCSFAINSASNSLFGGNFAAGGAIYFMHSSATIVTSVFTSNISGIQGGAIYIDSSSAVALLGFSFTSNSAYEGDDVYSDLGDVAFTSNCPAGRFGHKTSVAISVYRYREALSSCAGDTAPLHNVEGCDVCPAGEYQDEENQMSCKKCPAGKYGAEPGLMTEFSCTECPAGKYSEKVGRGSSSDHEDCDLCDAGKFGDEAGFASRNLCKPCQRLNEVSSDSGTACVCGAGYYMRGEESCVLCPPEKVDCIEPGVTIANLPVAAGYWRAGNSSEQIFLCENAKACFSNSSSGGGSCAAGYEGPLCSLCSNGYAKQMKDCVKCDSSKVIAYNVGLLASFVLVVMFVLVFNFRGSRTSVILRSKSFTKLATVLTSSNTRQTIAYVQIISSLSATLMFTYPTYFSIFTSWMSAANLDFSFLATGCVVRISHYDQLLHYTLAPLAWNAFAGYFLYRYSPKLKVMPSFGRLRTNILGFTCVMNSLLLPQVTMVIFNTFYCRKFDGDYGTYLIADYSLSCDAPEHQRMRAYASLMLLVYPLGIPLAIAWALFRFKEKLNPNQRELVFESGSESVGLAKAIQIRDSYDDIQHLRTLFSAYQPEYWWFENFEISRRLIFTSGLRFFHPGSVTQCGLALLCAFVCVRVYARYRPFVVSSSSTYGEIVQWQLAVTLLVTLLLKVSEQSEEKVVNKHVFDVFLVALQCAAPILMIIASLLETRGVREERKLEKHVEALVSADSLDGGGRAEEVTLGEKKDGGEEGGSGRGKLKKAQVVPV